MKLEHVVYSTTTSTSAGGIALEKISVKGIGNVCPGTADVPRYYAVWGNQGAVNIINLYVWPNVSSAATNGTAARLILTGYTQVTSYGSSDSSGAYLPTYLQYPCVYYALSCCAAKDGKHSLSAMYMKKFLGDCAFYRKEIYEWRKSVDSKDMFKVPDLTRTAQTG